MTFLKLLGFAAVAVITAAFLLGIFAMIICFIEWIWERWF